MASDKYNYQHTHIILILDASGSMSSIAADTIGSLKTFLEEQKKLPGFCTMTFITFSSSSTTIFNRLDLKSIDPNVFDKYKPSGCTALNDAIGDALDENHSWMKGLEDQSTPLPGNVVVAIMTDGEENSSLRYSSEDVKSIIKKLTTNSADNETINQRDTPAANVPDDDATEVPPPVPEQIRVHRTNAVRNQILPTVVTKEKIDRLNNFGVEFSFVYLGANIDSFAEGQKLGIAAKATSNWGADNIGVDNARQQISYAVGAMRMKGQKQAVKCSQLSAGEFDRNMQQVGCAYKSQLAATDNDGDYEAAFDQMRANVRSTEANRINKMRK